MKAASTVYKILAADATLQGLTNVITTYTLPEHASQYPAVLISTITATSIQCQDSPSDADESMITIEAFAVQDYRRCVDIIARCRVLLDGPSIARHRTTRDAPVSDERGMCHIISDYYLLTEIT